ATGRQALQEIDDLAVRLAVDLEAGARGGEQEAGHVLLSPQYGVDDDAGAVVAVEQRQRQGYTQRPGVHLADNVSALVAVEDWLEHLDGVVAIESERGAQLRVDASRGYRSISGQVFEQVAEAGV